MSKSKSKSSSKKSDDTDTYILIGILIFGIACYYYYYSYIDTIYDGTSIGGSPETIGVTPPDEKPVPQVKWTGTDGSLYGVVTGNTPFASTRRGYASKQLNPVANKSLEECKKACYQADINTNVVAIAPTLAKTQPVCQCFKVNSKVKVATDNSSVSTVAYVSTLSKEHVSASNTNEASKSQLSVPLSPSNPKCKISI